MNNFVHPKDKLPTQTDPLEVGGTGAVTGRVLPPPINIPGGLHKSITDEFEKGHQDKKTTKQDYYEEIRRKPLKLLMTREISRYYGIETYLKVTIKDILIYTVFLIVLSVLVMETPSSDMYMFTSSMADIFTHREFYVPDNNHPYYFKIKFNDIITNDQIWKYLELMISLFEKYNFYVKEENDDPQSNLHENLLVGLIRLRMVRVRNDSCTVVKQFRNRFENCYDYFYASAEDREPLSNWTYSLANETEHYSTSGLVSTYGGGGFYQDLPQDATTSREILENLSKNNWTDMATRAIIVDFTAYNANINLFCIVKLLFEIPPTGGVIPSFIIHTLRLIDFGKSATFYISITIFIGFFVFYTVEELYEMTYFKWEFIKSFWNHLDVCIVMMCYLVILTNLYQYSTGRTFLSKISHEDMKFVNFDHMVYVQTICNISMSLLVFFCWIKVLKYVGINHSMHQLQATLQLAFKDIMSYSIIFLTVFFTFAFVAHILLRKYLLNYHTFTYSVQSILRAGLGDFNYIAIEKVHPFLGPVFFLLGLYFLCYIYVVIYIAILLDRYTEVRSEIYTATVQMKIGDVIKNWFINFLKLFSYPLAARARDSFNKKKLHDKFQDIRYLLMRCGFTELEINMFFAKYEISEDRVMTEEDLRNIVLAFQTHGGTRLQLARNIVRHNIGEKLIILEDAINNASRKIAQIIILLEAIHAKMNR